MTGRLVVAAQPALAERLLREPPDGCEVVSWDGSVPPPRPDVRVWVAPYAVGRGPEEIAPALAALPDLSVVQLLSAGVEPWPALMPPGVVLCGGRGIHGGSTAELAVLLVLASIRQLPTYVAQQHDGVWQRHPPATLAGRRVLVLGAGDIGARVAAALRVLEAQVTLAARTARDGVVALDDALALVPETEVLVVALPLTPQTERLVDAALLGRLPAGALVVNVARGGLVDHDALTREVAAGRLRCALDVTDPEPLPAGHPLWQLPGALVTPHVGGGAEGWLYRAEQLVRAQLARIHVGEPPHHQVTQGY